METLMEFKGWAIILATIAAMVFVFGGDPDIQDAVIASLMPDSCLEVRSSDENE